MNRRAERHVGPGEKKSPFTKRTREMNQQYWRANNRYIHIREIDEKGYIYLKSQAFSTLNLPQRLGSIRRSWLSLDKSIGELSMVYKKTSALIRPGVSACNQFNSTRFVCLEYSGYASHFLIHVCLVTCKSARKWYLMRMCIS